MASGHDSGEETSVERPVRAYRRVRLGQLVEEFGGPKEAAKELGTVDTHLIAIGKGRRSVGDDLATKIELRAGRPIGWLDTNPALDERQAPMFSELDAHEAQLITLFRLIRDPQRRMDLLQRANAMAAEGNGQKSAANPFAGKRPDMVPDDSRPMPLDLPIKTPK